MDAEHTRKGSKKVQLTIRSVAALKPEGRDYVVWDAKLPGFGIRVSSKSKTFVLKYVFDGRQRMVSLGRLGDDLTVDEARRRAEVERGKIRDGTDPQRQKDEAIASGTLGDAWDAYCEARRKLPFGKRKAWKPKTHAEHLRVRKYLDYRLSRRPLASITRADLERLRDDITAGRIVIRRKYEQENANKGRMQLADRVMSYLGGFFSWAIDRQLYTGLNPAASVDRFGGKSRERVLDEDEFHRFMTAVEQYDGNIFVKAALKLYIFTACRREEVLGLEWLDVNLAEGHMQLRNAKTGDRIVPLPEEAVEMLRTLPRLPGNPYVIPGMKTGQHLVNITKPFKTVLKRAELADVTIHDLRRTYGAMCLRAGVDIYAVSKLLGHASVTTTERTYAFMPSEVLRAASRQVAERIRQTSAGEHRKIIPLRSAS